MRNRFILLLSIFCFTTLNAQKIEQAFLNGLQLTNDQQSFVKVPKYIEIQKYQKYFSEYNEKLNQDEKNIVGCWDIPNEIIKDELINGQDYSINGSMTFLPNKVFISRYIGYERNFPIAAIIGYWKVEDKRLITQVNTIIYIKTPVRLYHSVDLNRGTISPDDLSVVTINLPETVIYNDTTQADYDYGYFYYPFKTIISYPFNNIQSRYFTDRRRASRFSAENWYDQYPIIDEFSLLQEFHESKQKDIISFIGSIWVIK